MRVHGETQELRLACDNFAEHWVREFLLPIRFQARELGARAPLFRVVGGEDIAGALLLRCPCGHSPVKLTEAFGAVGYVTRTTEPELPPRPYDPAPHGRTEAQWHSLKTAARSEELHRALWAYAEIAEHHDEDDIAILTLAMLQQIVQMINESKAVMPQS